ncbi:hypothetical protein LguiB_002755 [Lonicera macranthoides]
MTMIVEEKFKIVRSIGEECIMEEELMNLLRKKPQPIYYDGFEPSGRMHIAQEIMKINNVNKLTSAGCKVKIWIADWFAQLNNKMGGDINKIQTLAWYFIEIWKSAGMNLEGGQVEFLWSSEEINSRPHEYWPLVMDIARRNSENSTDENLRNMLPGLLQEQENMSKSIKKSAIFMEDILPVHDHFTNDPTAKELLKTVQGYETQTQVRVSYPVPVRGQITQHCEIEIWTREDLPKKHRQKQSQDVAKVSAMKSTLSFKKEGRPKKLRQKQNKDAAKVSAMKSAL